MHKPTQLVKKWLTEEGSKVKMEVHTRKRRNYGDASLPSYKEARSGKRISAKNLKAWQWMEARCRVFETFGTNVTRFFLFVSESLWLIWLVHRLANAPIGTPARSRERQRHMPEPIIHESFHDPHSIRDLRGTASRSVGWLIPSTGG
ncbi:MAG TPA: hypothetical protein VIT91_17525 [Chthoniobacterales bacterium]